MRRQNRPGLSLAVALALALLAGSAAAQRSPLRQSAYTEVPPAPPIAADIADDVRRMRNYPDQPPVIPHSIRDYRIDLAGNKCLTCHSRKFTEQSQAPMISITHYQDRDGNFLGAVAPRRYNCTACHVPQTNARPVVENTFRDVDALIDSPSGRRE
jgi:nitrate reductase (cytochrome), electron transfer subunit